jgi:glycosyltransferase involved in cell wall biosynthesis
MRFRLAIISSHPIQYYAPWFQWLASESGLEVKVFYLWDFGVRPTHDPGFGQTFSWDIPLLEGYDYAFIPNKSQDPGTHHWRGLQNPELSKTVLAWKPDAVLMLGYAQDSFLKWMLDPFKSHIPLLLKGDSHRLISNPSLKNRVKHLALSLLFRRFSGFLYCGQANRDYFEQRGARKEQLFFSPHAIDLQRFMRTPTLQFEALQWRRNLQIPSEKKVILFAGKYESKKRPSDLLEAYLQLTRLDPCSNTCLIFAGSGYLEAELRQKASCCPDVFFAPLQNQSAMPTLYNAADLFVLPSYGPHETWGLAVQESLACGTPVIVSHHVGCHLDLVKDKNNGLVFEAGSINSLISSLQQALQPGQLEEWRPHCRAALDRYTYAEATRGLQQALAFVVTSIKSGGTPALLF